MFTRWVDTHCHFISEYSSAEEIQERLDELSALEFAVAISTEKSDFSTIPKMCSEYFNLYGAVGIHPSAAQELGKDELMIMRSLIDNPKIAAVGEIGLDYYRDKDSENIKKQKSAFEEQLQLALDLNKPVVVHARDSIQDCLDILKGFTFKKHIVFHCFTGNLKEAEAILKQGYWISYTGVITFPKNEEIRKAVEITPIDRIMVETDSPFLAPVPYRGKQNRPIWVSYVGEKLAEIKGWSVQEAQNITTSNAYRFFEIKL